MKFVLHVEGAHCTDCHVELTLGPLRPMHVAAKDWAAVSLELRVFGGKPERAEGGSSISLREQHRRQGRSFSATAACSVDGPTR